MAHRHRAQRWIASMAVVLGVAGATAAVTWRGGSASEDASEKSTSTAVASPPPPPSSTAIDRGGEPPAVPSAALTAALEPVKREIRIGCLSVTAGDRVLYEANPDAALVPASVTKLFTAAAAVEGLGAETRLRTSVRAAAPAASGVVAGDLWLVGGGDPVLGTDAWAAQLDAETPLYTSLDTLADQVVAAGIRRIEGRVVGDESRYDANRYVDSWPGRLINDGEAGPLSALSVNDGFRVWGHPGVAFVDPPAEAAAIFQDLLGARGVVIAGSAGAGRAGVEAVELGAVQSPQVGELVDVMLRESDNGTAELLAKELGLRRFGDGSTAAGVRAIRELLSERDVAMAGVTIADGSGLSEADRLTCGALTSLLSGGSAELADRLPVAGRDGTLARRFVGTPVAGRLRAKTGSLDGVAALAGYADNASGETLSFAFIVNGLPMGASARSAQDAVADALVRVAP